MFDEQKLRADMERARLKVLLMEAGRMKSEAEHKARQARARLYDTGSDSSVKTRDKWERRAEIARMAENAIYAELDEL